MNSELWGGGGNTEYRKRIKFRKNGEIYFKYCKFRDDCMHLLLQLCRLILKGDFNFCDIEKHPV